MVLKIVKHVSNDSNLESKKDWEKKKLAYIKTVKNGPKGSKAVCLADKIHNLRSLFDAYESQGATIWKKFNQGKIKKLWFEKKVYKMLKESFYHPLLNDYKEMIERFKKLS